MSGSRLVPALLLAMLAAALPAVAVALPAPSGSAPAGHALQQAAPPFAGVTWTLEAISTGVGDPVDMETGLTGIMNTDPSSYTVEFSPGGQISVRIGCNHGGGNWESGGSDLTVGAIATTLMGCGDEPEIGARFGQALPNATGWSLGDDGRLRINTSTGETLVFRPLLAAATWQWVGYTDREGTPIAPADPNGYTVTLNTDGSAYVRADCNSGSGSWYSAGRAFDVSNIGLSRVACAEGTLDWLFVSLLDRAASWSMEGGVLYLTMGDDGTIAAFTRSLVTP